MPDVVLVEATWQPAVVGAAMEAVRHALAAAGVATRTALDHLPPAEADVAYVVCPEAYFPFVQDGSHPTPQQLARTVALVVAGPDEPEALRLAADVAQSTCAAFALHPGALPALRAHGRTHAQHLPLVPPPATAPAPPSQRPLAAVALGAYSDRRAAGIARCAPVLAPRDHVVALDPAPGRQPAERADPAAAAALLGRSATRLLVHPGEGVHLDWFAAAQAVAAGAVVVTERARALGPLTSAEVVSARWEALPHVLAAALDDPGALDARAAAAARALGPAHVEGVGLRLAEALTVAAARAEQVRRPGDLPPRPQPREPALLDPVAERVAARDPRAMALGLVVREVRGLRRRLDELEAGAAPDAADEVDVHGPHAALEPAVSVLLTVYDLQDVVGEAIASVAAQEHPALELVVVDDASRDGSVAAVRAALEATELPALHVRRARNGGLAAARNLAIRHARAERLFVLDADNLVLPRGIERLEAALDADPGAAFAYGPLEVFDERGPKGLVSWAPWSPARLRFGNYIDAMALLRRGPVEAVGGYPEDDLFRSGLEDYALWCALAAAGHHAAFAPELVARYRANVTSLVALAQIDDAATWSLLVRRFPGLLAARPDAPPPTAAADR